MPVSGGDPLLERGEELEALRLHLDRRRERRRHRRDRRRRGRRQDAACSRPSAPRPPTSACASLSARCSPLERDFAFGVVRQVFEPVLGEPAAQGRARRRRRRRRRRSSPPGAATADGAEPSYAVLDALHRLALARRGRRPGRRARRRPAVVRRAVAALAGLPRAAPGGHAARPWSRRWPAGPAAVDGRIERELVDDPAALVLTPRALSERRHGRHARRSACAGCPSRASCAPATSSAPATRSC